MVLVRIRFSSLNPKFVVNVLIFIVSEVAHRVLKCLFSQPCHITIDKNNQFKWKIIRFPKMRNICISYFPTGVIGLPGEFRHLIRTRWILRVLLLRHLLRIVQVFSTRDEGSHVVFGLLQQLQLDFSLTFDLQVTIRTHISSLIPLLFLLLH